MKSILVEKIKAKTDAFVDAQFKNAGPMRRGFWELLGPFQAVVYLAVFLAIALLVLASILNLSIVASNANIVTLINNVITGIGQFGTWVGILIVILLAAYALGLFRLFGMGGGGAGGRRK